MYLLYRIIRNGEETYQIANKDYYIVVRKSEDNEYSINRVSEKSHTLRVEESDTTELLWIYDSIDDCLTELFNDNW